MMKSIVRCANCGHVIRTPESKCPSCGFQRGKAVSKRETRSDAEPTGTSMADIFERFYGDTTSEPEEKSPDPSFRQLPRLDPQNGSSEQEQKSKRFTWLIPLIAMIPVLISIVPEALEKSAPVMRHFLHQHIEDEFSNFEYVMVVAAARDIDPGAIITKEDIRVIIVRREAVPANAVSPLDIDLVIGKRTKNTMQKGDILLLKSMTDDE